MSRRCLIRCALALAALPLLAGCQLRADIELAVDGDGGGTLAVALELDEELEQEARAAGADVIEQVERAADDLEGWEVETAQNRVRLSTEFDDPRELRQVSGAFADALAAPELEPLEPFAVTVTEERVSVTGTAALRPTDEVARAGLDPAEATSLLEENVAYQIAVDLPGEILSHNADRREDERLVWQVPAGERVEIAAEAERPQTPPVALLAGIAAAAALVGGLLIALAWRRRRRRRRW